MVLTAFQLNFLVGITIRKMASKLAMAVHYKLSHFSEKVTHKMQGKYIFYKTNGVFEFLDVRDNGHCLWSKKLGCL